MPQEPEFRGKVREKGSCVESGMAGRGGPERERRRSREGGRNAIRPEDAEAVEAARREILE
jgi:hypothetical protein